MYQNPGGALRHHELHLSYRQNITAHWLTQLDNIASSVWTS